jgi:acetyl-CoA carboxylase carboxyltransferase component
VSWKKEVDQIEERRRRALDLGGEAAVARQHEKGRETIRERIGRLIDADSLHEIGPIAGHAETDEEGRLIAFTPGNYILAHGRIDGRPCIIGGEDFTQRGGSPTSAGLRKSVYAETLALQRRMPLVRLLEGGGGSVRGSGKRGPTPDAVFTPHRFLSIARALETVPVASAALGAVAGFPAARLVASHFAVMTRETSQVMIGGPALVERALGETKTKEELGGAAVHERSGVVDAVADDEAHALDLIRRFLSYLPSNVWERAPVRETDDPSERSEEALLSLIPRNRRRVYDARKLVGLIVDRDSFFELTPRFGRSQITALARLDGVPVGVLANDPFHLGGSMTAQSAQKFRRFVRLCETFGLPIVSFVDQPGFMIGSGAESDGTIRFGMEAIAETVRSTVPWASVIVRKSYGVAAAAHFGPEGLVLAWPSAERGALPLEGGVAVAFRKEIAEAEDPEAMRRELEERLSRGRTPFPSADAFSVHDLIDPRRTRPELCAWIQSLGSLLRTRTPGP